MDGSKLIFSLVMALIIEQLMQWVTQVSKYLIHGSTYILPEGLNNRMFEEWCAHLTEVEGKCCKLIFAMQTYPAALCMRQEAFGQLPFYKLLGEGKYDVVDPETDCFLAGNLQIGFGIGGLKMKGVSTQIDQYQSIENGLELPWKSTSIRFKWLESDQQVGLSVRYIVTLNNEEIPGELILSYTGHQFRNCLSGTVTRTPVVNGRVSARKIATQDPKEEDSP